MTIILIAIVVVLIFAYTWYVRLIKYRNTAREALSSVDVQLRKRHDLLPNILKLARQFMVHERTLIENLTSLRAQASKAYNPNNAAEVKAHVKAEGSLQSGLRQLFAVAENYPELRSSETIVQAQQSFNEVEGHIAAARRFYNSAVTQLNNAVEIFPGNIIAQLAKVQAMPFFEIEDEAVRKELDVNDYFQA